MEFRIWVEVRLAGRILHKQLVAQVEREATGIVNSQIILFGSGVILGFSSFRWFSLISVAGRWAVEREEGVKKIV